MRGPAVLRAVLAGAAATLALGGCGGGDDGGDGSSGAVLTIQAVPEASSTGPEADRIRRAFAAVEAAGLDAGNQRDGTAACEQLQCFARIVSDEVSISAWADDDAAEKASEHHVGHLGVTFVTSRVPRAEQAAYLRAIRGAVTERERGTAGDAGSAK